MSFYEFSQNNSGGQFVVNDKLCHRLFIEANTYKEAKEKAESLGVYFNGVENGIDCGCCGDRWHDSECIAVFPIEMTLSIYTDLSYKDSKNFEKTWFKKYGKFKRKEEPKKMKEKYSSYEKFGTQVIIENIEEYAQWLANDYGNGKPDTRIYYKDGRVVEINTQK